jgi:hypothetical protein
MNSRYIQFVKFYRLLVIFVLWFFLNPLLNGILFLMTGRAVAERTPWPVFLGCVALLFLMALPIRHMLKAPAIEDRPMKTPVFFSIFLSFHFLFLLAFSWMFSISNPFYFMLVLLTAVFVAYSNKQGMIGKVSRLMIFISIAVVAYWLKLIVVVPLAVVLLFLSMPRVSLRPGPVPVFIGTAMILAACWVKLLVGGSDPTSHIRISETKGVEPVIVAGGNEAWNEMSDSFRYAVEDCSGDRYIIGARSSGREGYDLAIATKTSPARVTGLLKNTPSSDRPVMDCDAGLFFAGDYKTGEVHIFSTDTFEETGKFDSGLSRLTNISIDTGGKFLFLGSDKEHTVVRADYSKPASIETMAIPSQSSDFLIDNRRLIVARISSLAAFDAYSGLMARRGGNNIPNPEFRVTMDRVHRKYIGTNMISGFITVYNSATLNPEKSRWLSQGIRFLCSDEDRGLIYVANYLSGIVYFIDSSTLKTRKKIFVGRRIRHLSMSGDGNELLIVSSAGFYRVFPDIVLGINRNPKAPMR